MWKYNVILTTARRWGLPKLQKNVRANRHDDDDDDGDGDENDENDEHGMVTCSMGVGDP